MEAEIGPWRAPNAIGFREMCFFVENGWLLESGTSKSILKQRTLQGFARAQIVYHTLTERERMRFQSNSLKMRALEIFAKCGPLNPPAWAVLAAFHPVRASYTYLLRLHRFGLLNRTRDESGLPLYSLSDRGRERLKWLSIPNGPNASPVSPKENTPHASSVPNAI